MVLKVHAHCRKMPPKQLRKRAANYCRDAALSSKNEHSDPS